MSYIFHVKIILGQFFFFFEDLPQHRNAPALAGLHIALILSIPMEEIWRTPKHRSNSSICMLFPIKWNPLKTTTKPQVLLSVLHKGKTSKRSSSAQFHSFFAGFACCPELNLCRESLLALCSSNWKKCSGSI